MRMTLPSYLLALAPETRHWRHPAVPLAAVWLNSLQRLTFEVIPTSRPPPMVQSDELYRGTQFGTSSNERTVNRPVKAIGNIGSNGLTTPRRSSTSGRDPSDHSHPVPQTILFGGVKYVGVTGVLEAVEPPFKLPVLLVVLPVVQW
jgi:hypothetical protein